MNYCVSTIFHLIKVITMTTAEATRPGIIPKGMPTTRLNNARKNRMKHLHILIDNSFDQILCLSDIISEY